MPATRKTSSSRTSRQAANAQAAPSGAARKRPAAAAGVTAPAKAKTAPAQAPAAPEPRPAAPEPVRQAKSKAKLVRDSFTMPQADFDLVAALKQRALRFERPAKKSELLRAGLHVLSALDDKRLRAALDALMPLKPGRPKKNG